MADIMGLAASAAGGGVFGLFGTAVGRLVGYFERRQTLAHEQRRWQHEIQLTELKASTAHQQAIDDQARLREEGRWQGLTASLQADASIGPSYLWVNAIRGLTRPLLTLLLWGITVGIWIGADAAGRASIIETTTFAATAATLWWFGDRSALNARR